MLQPALGLSRCTGVFERLKGLSANEQHEEDPEKVQLAEALDALQRKARQQQGLLAKKLESTLMEVRAARAARADLGQENDELKKKLAKAKLDAVSWRMTASHKDKHKQDRERWKEIKSTQVKGQCILAPGTAHPCRAAAPPPAAPPPAAPPPACHRQPATGSLPPAGGTSCLARRLLQSAISTEPLPSGHLSNVPGRG